MIKKLKIKNQKLKTNGQVLLITVLTLGGAIIAASAIAGYLMLYSVRQSSDLADSGKAIYAADAGIEWDLYRRFVNRDYPQPVFSNGAAVEVNSMEFSTRSVGRAANSFRALELRF